MKEESVKGKQICTVLDLEKILEVYKRQIFQLKTSSSMSDFSQVVQMKAASEHRNQKSTMKFSEIVSRYMYEYNHTKS